MIAFIVFFSFSLLFLIIPALAFVRFLNINISSDLCIRFSLLLSLGVIVFTLFSVVFRLLGIEFHFLWTLPFITIPYLIHRGYKSRKNGEKFQNIVRGRIYIFSFLVVLIGVLAQNLVMFRGGWSTDKGLMFPSLDDNMWNISFIAELSRNFPPQHPAMDGEWLKNNHYLYQFFLASVRGIINADIFDLYFRFGPILVSLLFGLSIYAVTSLFTSDKKFHAITVFITLFSGSFSYLVPILLKSNFDWKGNTFFSDQPFDQIINPYSVLGFSFVLLSIYSLHKYLLVKKGDKLKWALIFALFSGCLFGFKSFGGVILLISILIIMLLGIIAKPKVALLLPFIFSIVIFIPIFYLITEFNKAGLVWSPGWILTEMMVGTDKLNIQQFAQIENFYTQTHNTLGLLKIKGIEFLIYFLGNFGVRILGFLYLFYIALFFGKANKEHIIIIRYIFIISFVAFIIPLLFNLGGNAHNIVQFTPYSLLLCALATGIALEKYIVNLRNHRYLKIIIVIIFISVAIPVNVKNIISKVDPPSGVINLDELNILNFLRDNSSQKAVILIDPRQYRVNPIYISALSERHLFIASAGDSIQTGRDPYPRLKNVYDFFDDKLGERESFLKKNRISFIYLLKPHSYYSDKERFFDPAVKIISDGETNVLYKVE